MRRLICPGVSIIGKEADEGDLAYHVRDPIVLLMAGCSWGSESRRWPAGSRIHGSSVCVVSVLNHKRRGAGSWGFGLLQGPRHRGYAQITAVRMKRADYGVAVDGK